MHKAVVEQARFPRSGGDGTVEARVAALLGDIKAGGDDAVFTRIDAQEALAQAAQFDQLPVEQRGPLWGRVLSVKDMFDIAGQTTIAGCAKFSGNPPARQDAVAVARLRSAHAVIVGKTSMAELAYSGLGLNPVFGTPPNALDPARIPGGSSSGAAVAVARGYCDVAVGSDTGGSVRIPAAFNGMVGFKPTQSRIPRDGMVELSHSQDTVGLIASTVAQCAQAYAVLAGHEVGGLAVRKTLAGVRVAVAHTYLCDELDPPVAHAFERGLGLMRSAGAELVRTPFDVAGLIADIHALGGVVGPEAYTQFRHLLDLPGNMDPMVADQIRFYEGHDQQNYAKALELRLEAQASFAQAMAGFDVLACPAVPIIAPRFDELRDGKASLGINRRILRNTSPFNTLDVPAITVPCHRADEPAVGLMLVGRHMQEAALLQVALDVEAALSPGA